VGTALEHYFGAPEWRSGLRHCILVLEASLQTPRFESTTGRDLELNQGYIFFNEIKQFIQDVQTPSVFPHFVTLQIYITIVFLRESSLIYTQ
jgi:hypothetical protein